MPFTIHTLKEYLSLRIFLPVLILLGTMGAGSCGGGSDQTPPPVCDLTSQRNQQRLSGERREDYYPKRFSRDLNFRNYGANISPTEKHKDIARKVSRSVFELEVNGGMVGSAWLIAPKYAVTAAHAFIDSQTLEPKPVERGFVHTFDGDRIEAEREYVDPRVTKATDLALLRLEREIDPIPLKIADEIPEKNEFLMAMGGGGMQRGLGGWTVSAGPALELKSGYPISTYYHLPDRMYHAVPISVGMSGGPIFNDKGEVVSIASSYRGSSPDFSR
ncbi:MAG: serine protease [Candidatus Dadabacteria bacterium]|nr:serine protease [Candidatus Dadabacteria bacterium]